MTKNQKNLGGQVVNTVINGSFRIFYLVTDITDNKNIIVRLKIKELGVNPRVGTGDYRNSWYLAALKSIIMAFRMMMTKCIIPVDDFLNGRLGGRGRISRTMAVAAPGDLDSADVAEMTPQDLEGFAGRSVTGLSGGEARRLAFASLRALFEYLQAETGVEAAPDQGQDFAG